MFEQGPIRPPSEAKSLLIRVTRNCPWNKCTFCRTYKGEKFELRPVSEIKRDIQEAKDIADQVDYISWQSGCGGKVTEEVLNYIYSRYDASYFHMACWLYYGGESVFLQDANSIILKTRDLLEIITFLKEKFPQVTRITTYGRSNTIAKKKVMELKELATAGLSRIHIGLETGHDPLLNYIQKGVTASEHVEAGKKVKEAGISLSEYVILGLGGRKMTREHAQDTANILNSINPDFIRLRTLAIREDMPLYQELASGAFQALTEEEMVREERLLIENLEGIESQLISDHALNLLEEVNGVLPQDKEKMLALIDTYLDFPEDVRANFTLGKRAMVYHSLNDLLNKQLYLKTEAAKLRLQKEGNFEETVAELRQKFI